MESRNDIKNCEDRGRVIAFASEDGTYQEDEFGNFRIIVKGQESDWVDKCDGIARLEINGELFIGVSAFWVNSLPCRCAFKVQIVDEDGDVGYYKFKISDLTTDEILKPKEIEDILRDPFTDEGDYGFLAKETKIKDFIKLRITDFGVGRFLNKEEVHKYLCDTLSSEDFDVFDEKGKKINVKNEEKQKTLDDM